VPLEGVYTDLYILDRPAATRRFDIDQLREDLSVLERNEPERVNGLEFITQPEAQRLFILGKPGAGKTTFLKYVALQAAQGKLDKVPIFVSLRDWSESGLELTAYVVKEFGLCGFPRAEPFVQRILMEGQAVALFDGLDEVKREDGHRKTAIDALCEFSRRHQESQCMITCRTAATERQFEQYTEVEVADFTDEQVQAYMHKWFADDPGKRELLLANLGQDEHHGLRELTRSPLLLSVLCLAVDETGHLPQRRAGIYAEAFDVLLKRWDASRGVRRDEVYRKLSVARKPEMLARIAAETFERGEYFLPRGQLERQIEDHLRQLIPIGTDDEVDGASVLKAIEAQNGILVERAHGIYAFAHSMFQEYFVAFYLAELANQEKLLHLLDGHVADDRWHEVFVLSSSMLDDADLFFEQFADTLERLAREEKRVIDLLSWAEEMAAWTVALRAREETRIIDPLSWWEREKGIELVTMRSLYLYSARHGPRYRVRGHAM